MHFTLKGNAVVLFSVWLQMHAIYRYVVVHTTMTGPQCWYSIHAWKIVFPLYNYLVKPTYNNRLCIWMHKHPFRTKNTCQTQSGQNTILFQVITYLLYTPARYTRFLHMHLYNIGPGMEFAEACKQ